MRLTTAHRKVLVFMLHRQAEEGPMRTIDAIQWGGEKVGGNGQLLVAELWLGGYAEQMNMGTRRKPDLRYLLTDEGMDKALENLE